MSSRTRTVAVAVNAWIDARGEVVLEASEQAVLGPEVVSPLADAVRLVDGDEPHADAADPLAEALAAVADQPLGRDVQQPARAAAHHRHRRAALLWRLRAVQARGGHAARHQAVDLVLHQRDERRDDQRQPRARRAIVDQRRRLEAERLAAAGRQHQHAVAALEDRVDRLALPRPELAEAPVALEHLDDGIGGDGGHAATELGGEAPRPSAAGRLVPARPASAGAYAVSARTTPIDHAVTRGRCRFVTRQAAGAMYLRDSARHDGCRADYLANGTSRMSPEQPRRLRPHLVHVLRLESRAVARIQQPVRRQRPPGHRVDREVGDVDANVGCCPPAAPPVTSSAYGGHHTEPTRVPLIQTTAASRTGASSHARMPFAQFLCGNRRAPRRSPAARRRRARTSVCGTRTLALVGGDSREVPPRHVLGPRAQRRRRSRGCGSSGNADAPSVCSGMGAGSAD